MIDPDLLRDYGIDDYEIGKRLLKHFKVTEDNLGASKLNYFVFCSDTYKVYGIRTTNLRYTRSWDYNYYLEHAQNIPANGVMECFHSHLPEHQKVPLNSLPKRATRL